MGVYIKGMEMPTCCAVCLVGYSLLGHRCMRTGRFVDRNEAIEKREEQCPLVPVPPHGDLIDIGEALKRLPENYGKDDLERVIIRAPAIIPAEEAGVE